MGIGVVAAALAVEVLGMMAMIIAFRLFFVTPRWVYWVGFYAWIHSGWVAALAKFVVMLLITQPFACARDRFRPRIAFVAFGFALIGILGLLLDLVLRVPGLAASTGRIDIVASHVAGLCSGVAYVLVCVHLLLRVDRAHQRLLWLLLCPAVAAQVLVLFVSVSGAVLYFSGATPPVSGSPVFKYLLVDPLWWQKNGIPACGIALLLALLLFLRRLRAAPRSVP